MPVNPLANRVFLVVGASSGIGRASAKLLTDGGAIVAALARRHDRLTDLQTECGGADSLLRIAEIDVTKSESVREVIPRLVRELGRIDALVYAAGSNISARSLEALSTNDWDGLLATNLSGAFHCTQAVLPTMRLQGEGLLVYISTAAIQRPDVSGVAYQSSKHGLSGLAHGTAVEEKRNGIRTTLIFPGLCDTEILTKRPQPTPRQVLDLALRPEDVAQAVLFVASLPPRAVVPELQIVPSGI